MKEIYKVAVCGGDARLLRTAEMFALSGCDCRLWGCSDGSCDGAVRYNDLKRAVSGASVIILPIPAFNADGTIRCLDKDYGTCDAEGLFSMLQSGAHIFAGKVTGIIKRLAAEYNLSVTDYGEREEFAVMNATPTAEAAILIAMEKLNVTVSGSDFAVLGYGKTGRALALRLKALQGEVTVAARSPGARAAAESDGMLSVSVDDFLNSSHSLAAVFNTIPCPLITKEAVINIREGLIIDLASLPGGLTPDAKEYAGARFTHALSLPGRYFPKTAGEIIYRTAVGVLRERGVSI